MTTFFISLIAVAVLLVTAVPGFIFIRKKIVDEGFIKGLALILFYVCNPCLALYTFASAEFSKEKLINLGIFALLCTLVQIIILGAAYLVLRRKYENPLARIMTIATTFANSAFFGIPIIEALLPEIAANVIIYTTVYTVIMNTIGWTVGCAIISGDAKFISAKKIFLNPAMVGLVIAMPVFLFNIEIQANFLSMITICARMSSPLSMLVLGMRLATAERISSLFLDVRLYLAIAVKQVVMPLVAFGILYFLPVAYEIKAVLFIICACPVAAVVLNFSELVGKCQREAANAVVLGTMLSIVTLPIVTLLLPLL